MAFLQRIWQRFRFWISSKPKPLQIIKIEELPDSVHPNTIYLIGDEAVIWFAALLCPCGCDEVIHLNCLKENRPHWQFIEHKNHTISFHPSINRSLGCRSHFFIRHGNIQWCE